MEIFLIIITLGLFLLVCIFRSSWAIFLISFLLPFYVVRFFVSSLPLTLLEGAILIFFAVWLVKIIIKKEWRQKIKNIRIRLRNQRLLIWMPLFLLAATISVFLSPNLRDALGIWRAYFIEPFLLFVALLAIAKGAKGEKTILSGLALSVLVISGVAIFQKISGLFIPPPWQDEATRRVVSIFPYPNAVGLYLAPIVSLFFILLISHKTELVGKLFRWLSLAVVVGGVLAIVFAVSEGALIAVAVAFFLAALFTKWWKIALGVVLLSALIIFIFPAPRAYLIEKISFQDVSGDVRLALWQGTFKMIKDNPIGGVGLSGFQERYVDYKLAKHTESLVYPHNLVLNFWVETGLLGLVSFLLILEKFFLPAGKRFVKTLKNSPLLLGLAAAALAIVVQGMVDAPYFKNDLAAMFWILLALLSIEQKRLAEEKTKTAP